jgi:hypothetical protein
VVYDLAGRTAICSLPGGERLVVRQGVSLAEATPEFLRSLPLGVTVVYDAAAGNPPPAGFRSAGQEPTRRHRE